MNGKRIKAKSESKKGVFSWHSEGNTLRREQSIFFNKSNSKIELFANETGILQNKAFLPVFVCVHKSRSSVQFEVGENDVFLFLFPGQRVAAVCISTHDVYTM